MISRGQVGNLVISNLQENSYHLKACKVLWLQILKVIWKVCVKKFFQEVYLSVCN